jgi:hypothetical protein
MSWKTHYLEVCEILNWNNILRVREARASMSEKTARHTANVIPVYVADLAAVPLILVNTCNTSLQGTRRSSCRPPRECTPGLSTTSQSSFGQRMWEDGMHNSATSIAVRNPAKSSITTIS